jgi:hypothetical protein
MLVGKIIILGALNILYVFYEGPFKMAHYKKNIQLWDVPMPN